MTLRSRAVAAAGSLAVAGAVLLAGCADDEAELGRFAETLCIRMSTFYDAGAALVDAAGEPMEDPDAFHDQMVDAIDGFLAALDDGRSAIGDEPLPVEDGELIAASFVPYFDGYYEGVRARLVAFRTADPTAPDYPGLVAEIPDTLSDLQDELGDPFGALDSQELLTAMRDEPSCVDVVEVS